MSVTLIEANPRYHFQQPKASKVSGPGPVLDFTPPRADRLWWTDAIVQDYDQLLDIARSLRSEDAKAAFRAKLEADWKPLVDAHTQAMDDALDAIVQHANVGDQLKSSRRVLGRRATQQFYTAWCDATELGAQWCDAVHRYGGYDPIPAALQNTIRARFDGAWKPVADSILRLAS